MMNNYEIFDENYYLTQYPWVKAGIEQNLVQSGLDHFQRFGQATGLTEISRYFDEQYYLANNPDIVPFTQNDNNPNAPFASGLDHFLQFGYLEGRTVVSPNYNENYYLATNPDVKQAVENGIFKTGYQHFILAGATERRHSTSFIQSVFTNDLDVIQAVEAGIFKTARDHYFQYGQFEPSRNADFLGTSGNDQMTAVGVGTVRLFGVDNYYGVNKDENNDDGRFEFDTLTGGNGQDTFQLATVLLGNLGSFAGVQPFYIGPGFATIENFTPGQDRLFLAGTIDQYLLVINTNQDLEIKTNQLNVGDNLLSSLDTVAIIKGGGNFNLFVHNDGFDSSYFELG